MEKRKKRRVNISLPPEAHDWIKKECGRKGINFSTWVYLKILEELKNGKKSW